MSGATASNDPQHIGFAESRASNLPDARTGEDKEAIPSGGSRTATSDTKPNAPKRTPSRIKRFFRRSRSSTTETMQNQSNPQSVQQESACSTPAATAAPLPSTPFCSQYIGHSAENSENSHSTMSASTYSNTSTTNNSIAQPWHLSVTPKNRPRRFSTGLSFKNPNALFASSPPRPQRSAGRKRSTSTNNAATVEADNYISMPAATGAGLKARRFSTNLPADLNVETVELHDEYTSASIVPGRRGKLVGKGSTATVKLMIQKGASVADGVFAVKEFRKRGQHETEEEYNQKVHSEYMIAKSLHHPNIVESVRLCTHGGRWNHVMEFCAQGEIYTLVQKNYLTLDDNLCLFKQLLRGVAHLHSNGIAHRDIKLENLLMNNEGHLKITDFGVSEVFCGDHPGTRRNAPKTLSDDKDAINECRLCAPGICGSLPYIAPEVIDKSGHYDPRALDVWSCAIVLLSMIYKGNPWPAADRTHPHHHYARFLTGWDKFIDTHPDGLVIAGSDIPSCGPLFASLRRPAVRNLVLRMMHPNPGKRITVREAVGDRAVQAIECCCLEGYEDGDGVGGGFDAREKGSGKVVRRVNKVHNHLPPRESRLPGGLLQKLDLGSR